MWYGMSMKAYHFILRNSVVCTNSVEILMTFLCSDGFVDSLVFCLAILPFKLVGLAFLLPIVVGDSAVPDIIYILRNLYICILLCLPGDGDASLDLSTDLGRLIVATLLVV